MFPYQPSDNMNSAQATVALDKRAKFGRVLGELVDDLLSDGTEAASRRSSS